MKLRHHAIAAVVFMSIPTVGRAGIVVVSHLPRQAGGGPSDTASIDPFDPFGSVVFQRLADNFSTSTTFSVQTVRWWGFYGGPKQSHDPPSGDETMRIRFYGARAGDGLPDDNNIIFEESFLNPSRTPTGLRVTAEISADEYVFETDLGTPLSLSANTPYWLEVAQIGIENSTYRWEDSLADLDSKARINSFVPQWALTGTVDQAFELIAVPEPNGICLVMVGLWFVELRRARKNIT